MEINGRINPLFQM